MTSRLNVGVVEAGYIVEGAYVRDARKARATRRIVLCAAASLKHARRGALSRPLVWGMFGDPLGWHVSYERGHGFGRASGECGKRGGVKCVGEGCLRLRAAFLRRLR
jgi:hypothetical protein